MSSSEAEGVDQLIWKTAEHLPRHRLDLVPENQLDPSRLETQFDRCDVLKHTFSTLAEPLFEN
jgi:hypothetical protein